MRIRGQLFLLKISDGNSPEAWTTLAGQRSASKQLHSEPIDATDKDDSRFRKLLEGGVRNATISARGLITDADSYTLLCNIATQGLVRRFQVTFANGLTFTGPFQIEKWGEEGDYQDSQQYDITLVGADDVEMGTEQTPGELLIGVSLLPLLLTEGGDPFFLIESTFPFVPDASGTQLVEDSAPDLANLTFVFDPVAGEEPTALTLAELAVAAGLHIRTVTTYATPGVYNWQKPAGASGVRVECGGGGGGGGSAAVFTSASSPTAASGGGGGALISAVFDPDDLASSESITVGAGGAGGAAVVATAATQGNDGSVGGNSSFGSKMIGYGGGGGVRGAIAGSNGNGGGGGGGAAGAGGAGQTAAAGTGGLFGGGTGTRGGAGGNTLAALAGGAGGGGAGGGAGGFAGGYAVNGGQGGGSGAGGGTTSLGTGGAGAIYGTTATNAGGVGSDGAAAPSKNGATLYPTFALSMRGSGGGGGGNARASGSIAQAGNGGRGQQPGGGGGGGGSATGSTGVTKTSGAGGIGGDGVVRVTVDY